MTYKYPDQQALGTAGVPVGSPRPPIPSNGAGGGVTSINGENGDVTLVSARNTVVITEPTSSTINLDLPYKLTVSTTPPGSPQVNDLWVNIN